MWEVSPLIAVPLTVVPDFTFNFVAGSYLNFQTPIALSSGFSISRGSAAYSTTSAGLLTQFSSNTFRVTDLGLLIEDARTNVVLWNRDLTNAAWTKTNVTAALDQTGADGAANAASSIVATAANGTVLQAITLAVNDAAQSAYVKRITGTGTVNMTMDNGATWTAIPVTSNWAPVSIPTQNLANPTVGFQIVTSGDKIAVDFVQNETGANNTFPSSPIPTTTASATRAADVITPISGVDAILSSRPWSLLGDVKFNNPNTDNWSVIASAPNSVQYLGGFLSDTAVGITAGGFLSTTIGNSLTLSGPRGAKLAASMDITGRSVVGGGGVVASDATNQDISTGDMRLGSGNFNAFNAFGYFRRVVVWSARLPDAMLQALTAP